MARTNQDAPCESGWHVRPGRVLLVDDDPRILASLGRVLREEHEVETALGGEAALERLARAGPASVVARAAGGRAARCLRRAASARLSRAAFFEGSPPGPVVW